jgi:2-keto-4-pentenoate hydratase/2-oxohepta-3-ene-1,7-dioic acid hydratase in catechol pathway
LVLRIDRLGKNIPVEFAHRYYNEIGLGIDFTARDLQDELKKKGLPWEKAKGFDGSAVISADFISKEILGSSPIHFSLQKNGKLVQSGSSEDMIFGFDQIISYVSKYMTLKIGDFIFTGTPSGVGPVQVGDELEGRISEQNMFTVRIR